MRRGLRRAAGPADPDQRRVCVVATVKDSPANLLAFVERNLAAGADHLVLFLDDADPAGVDPALARHPHVTAVPTDEAHWHGDRPRTLNLRQVANANLVNAVLSGFPSVAWLFHLDGDEQLHVDRDRLVDLPEDVAAVRLHTLEALSQRHWDGPVDRFKRQLGEQELCLLTALGAIAAPTMDEYFRGHRQKPGMRPNLGRLLRIHSVEDHALHHVTPFRAPWLRVLHFESHDGEEFVRKWRAHLSSGGARFRDNRGVLRNAIAAVVDNTALTDEQRDELLLALYHRHVEDDRELLDRLGFLVTPRAYPPHAPLALPREEAALLRRCLGALATGAVAPFLRNSGTRPAVAVAEVVDRLGAADRDVADRLAAALAAEVTLEAG